MESHNRHTRQKKALAWNFYALRVTVINLELECPFSDETPYTVVLPTTAVS